MKSCCLMGLGLAVVAGAADPAYRFSSGPDPVPLLELFTSEGCSSCPPAERWLKQLRHDDGLWRDFVPLAWHVNYWDRLGWKDRLAQQRFTDRQYTYAERWSVSSVYTPGFVRGGDEWRIRDGQLTARGAAVGGALTVVVAAGQVRIAYPQPEAISSRLIAHVGWLGGGIVSEVRSGENRGRKLEHEFAVLAWAEQPLLNGTAVVEIPVIEPALPAPRRALAVWVSRSDDLIPLQATGGWLVE